MNIVSIVVRPRVRRFPMTWLAAVLVVLAGLCADHVVKMLSVGLDVDTIERNLRKEFQLD